MIWVSMFTFVGWSVGWSVCQNNAKKVKKWVIQPKSENTKCFDGGMDLRTFLHQYFLYLCPPDYFCLLNSWKNVKMTALDSAQNRRYQRPVYKVYSYILVNRKCTIQIFRTTHSSENIWPRFNHTQSLILVMFIDGYK